MDRNLLYVAAIVFLLVIMYRAEGFRSDDKRAKLAKEMHSLGKPSFYAARNRGIDGAEYNDLKQLWYNRKYTPENIEKFL